MCLVAWMHRVRADELVTGNQLILWPSSGQWHVMVSGIDPRDVYSLL